jgi:alpha-glucosidase
MKTIISYSLQFVLYMSLISCNSIKDNWELKSPDALTSVIINSNPGKAETENQLSYQLKLKKDGVDRSVLFSSPLGIIREDGDFTKNLTFLKSRVQKNIKVEYVLISGKERKCKNEYNEIVLEFKNADNKPLNIIFRAFNDGIAFCYEFPGAEDKYVRIINEKSGFNLPGAKGWMHAYDTVTKWSPAYETYFEGPVISGTPAPSGKNGWGFPVLFETSDNQWLLISESGLDGNYVASHLDVSGKQGLYMLRNPEKAEAMGFFETSSYAKPPFRTPWRVIISGNELKTIIESNLITDLAEDCKLKDTSWIKPGRATWSWWYDHDSPQDYKLMIPYIDFAAEMGWEYFLVDANWNIMKNGTIVQLADYASKKGVGLLLWYNSGGKHNEVTEQPRDLMDKRDIRRKEFQRIHEMGVKGVKVDFFQSDKEEIIRQYIEILEDAAEFEILVNFHGCTIPKGWSRTYPNLVSTEGIRGAESYSFDAAYPEKAPAHLAIVPFTRGVIGPSDYTPGAFSDQTYPHITTNGFEIALPVILESGITHFADAPETYLKMPDFVIAFLKDIPVVWDEVKFLDGYPGKYVVLARRSGEKWYLAGINGQKESQSAQIDISGITKSGTIKIITEGGNPRTLVEKEFTAVSGLLQVSLQPLGGFVAVVQK